MLPPHSYTVSALGVKSAELRDTVELQDQQQRVADRMRGGDSRLLVYHGLGSGKSLAALAAAESLGGNYGVVTPAALKGNYQTEIAKFTKNVKPQLLSYTGVGRGRRFAENPDTAIFDEAHRLRNSTSASALAAQELGRNSKNMLLLTGTPIPNQPSDLASLLGLLNNERITPEQFDARYVGRRTTHPTWLSYLTGGVDEDYVKNEPELRKKLQGHVDYHPGKLPEGVTITDETVKVPLSSQQVKVENAVRGRRPWLSFLEGDSGLDLSSERLKRLRPFLTGLRQASLSTLPFLAGKDALRAFSQSGKLQQAFSDLKGELAEDPKKKALIYSNSIAAGVVPYAAALQKAKIPFGVLHGSIPEKEWGKSLQDYNANKLRVLLMGPAAAEGISAKGTTMIQMLDPHWHESRSSQAVGRGLRFDSHEGLPEKLRQIKIKRYLSTHAEPSWLQYLLGKQRQPTADEALSELSMKKEKQNELFRQILRDEGSVK